jgi:H+/Cl- antiporter ClcA
VLLRLWNLQSYWASYAAWTAWMVAFTLLALSVSHLVTPLAVCAPWPQGGAGVSPVPLHVSRVLRVSPTHVQDGSGIPQMKAYLGGSDVRKFFTWRVMLAKLLGLFFAQAAGLPVGKEVGSVATAHGTRVSMTWGAPWAGRCRV